ncbi:MAG: hypothetical protein EKK49_20350 [Rhodocyclaceae bacterium]|nr:MAG: hypothetical protein EKK49_20350 [Rhodocyclaceae bacterium]
MGCLAGIDRNSWTPKLTKKQEARIRQEIFAEQSNEDLREKYERSAIVFIAYHAKTICTDNELISQIDSIANFESRSLSYPKWDVVRATLGAKTPRKRKEKVKYKLKLPVALP